MKENEKNVENMKKMNEAFVEDGINPLYVLSLINKVGDFSCVFLFYLVLFFKGCSSFQIFILLIHILQALPHNAILVADGGDFIGSASYIVHPGGPLQWLDSGVFGTLGVGAGFALGAKVVRFTVTLPINTFL